MKLQLAQNRSERIHITESLDIWNEQINKVKEKTKLPGLKSRSGNGKCMDSFTAVRKFSH